MRSHSNKPFPEIGAVEPRFARLRLYNIALGFLHAVQAVVIVLLANDFKLPILASFLEGPPGTPAGEPTILFRLSVAWGVAGFLLMSSAAHFMLATRALQGWYSRNLLTGRNYARWIEYSFSASLMVALIALLTGILDAAALGALMATNAAMILFGLIMEHYEAPGKPNWMPFWFGSIIGLVPWLVIGLYLWSPGVEASPPAFVYGIFVSLFLFFNSFAVNMFLQYKQIGPWKDYLFGESVYMALSLVSKSALAWQVFSGTLAGG